MEIVERPAHHRELDTEVRLRRCILEGGKAVGTRGTGVAREPGGEDGISCGEIGGPDPHHDVEVAFGLAAGNRR